MVFRRAEGLMRFRCLDPAKPTVNTIQNIQLDLGFFEVVLNVCQSHMLGQHCSRPNPSVQGV